MYISNSANDVVSFTLERSKRIKKWVQICQPKKYTSGLEPGTEAHSAANCCTAEQSRGCATDTCRHTGEHTATSVFGQNK